MKKLFSVAVPCYNSQDYMNKCVDSLLAGGEEVEILIVDDGSTDDTGKIADDYQARFPKIVRAIHQPNKGHGGALNTAIAAATGEFFFVVDSDDWLDKKNYPRLLQSMHECIAKGGVDLIVADYIYQHQDITKNRVIGYGQVFPHRKICTWSQTHRFALHQYLTLHTNIFRTQLIKDSGLVLPEHVFYEDNVFCYYPVALVKKIYYTNEPLYHYVVDRDGQSVAEATMTKRYRMQIAASLTCFTSYHLSDFDNEPQLKACLFHFLSMMMTIGSVFARLSDEPESENDFETMWAKAREFDPQMADKIRHRTMARIVSHPGPNGIRFTRAAFKFAHGILQFN